jgi:hypothetical protein
LHRLLKISGVNQFSRMIERGLHILFGESKRLFGNLGSRAVNRRHRLVCGIEEHPERLLRLIDCLLGQIAQFGRDFQFRFNHDAVLPFWTDNYHISATASLLYLARPAQARSFPDQTAQVVRTHNGTIPSPTFFDPGSSVRSQALGEARMSGKWVILVLVVALTTCC